MKRIIYLFSAICLLPLLLMIVNSFSASSGLSSYVNVLFLNDVFFTGYWNSFIYTTLIILFNLPLSLISAYGISRFAFRGKGLLMWIYIVLMLMPFQATIVPQYMTLKALNLINSPVAVIIPNIFTTFGTILLAQHMRGIHPSLFEAGRIEGMHAFRLFCGIAVPMSRALIFALTVLTFINYWSMVEQPIIFIADAMEMPLSVMLNSSLKYNVNAYAMGVLFSILPLLLYQLAYQDLIYGISLSSGAQATSIKESKHQKKYYKIMMGFLIFMLICTFITNKVTFFSLPIVEVVTPQSMDIKSITNDPYSKSLGYFTYVVPDSAIIRAGSETFVYIAEKENQRWEISGVAVTVYATNQYHTAIMGGISKDSIIVVRSDKDIRTGDNIRVYSEGQR